MRATLSIFKRELAGYFATPVAYVFIVIFLVLAGVFTFYHRARRLLRARAGRPRSRSSASTRGSISS
jgi:ABC-type transport system involved in multi-copper enzyme maturation permease subunit